MLNARLLFADAITRALPRLERDFRRAAHRCAFSLTCPYLTFLPCCTGEFQLTLGELKGAEDKRFELLDAKKREKNPAAYTPGLLFFNQVKLIKRQAALPGAGSFRSKIQSKTVTSKNAY